ncbi:hypothetical protein FJ364_03555, partial [Candidatus Dependentiae bacterium]|nr:hypothetical protein [Candidatus Dependentiae bacterium]
MKQSISFISSLLLLSFITCINAEEPNVSVMFNPTTNTVQAVSASNSSDTPSASSTEKIKDVAQDNKDNDEANVYLNFDDASLNSVVNYLAERKK